MGIAVPWTHKKPIKGLVGPDFPDVMEAEALTPNTDHAPAIKKDDANGDYIEHRFCGQAVTALDGPERIYSNRLSGDPNDKEIG